MRRGFTQRGLAAKVGVIYWDITRIENRKQRIDPDLFLRLVKAFPDSDTDTLVTAWINSMNKEEKETAKTYFRGVHDRA